MRHISNSSMQVSHQYSIVSSNVCFLPCRRDQRDKSACLKTTVCANARTVVFVWGDGFTPSLPDSLKVVSEATQLVRARRVLELTQCFGFDLPDALARHVELFADFFQRVVTGHLTADAHAQHLGFTRRQTVQNVFHH